MSALGQRVFALTRAGKNREGAPKLAHFSCCRSQFPSQHREKRQERGKSLAPTLATTAATIQRGYAAPKSISPTFSLHLRLCLVSILHPRANEVCRSLLSRCRVDIRPQVAPDTRRLKTFPQSSFTAAGYATGPLRSTFASETRNHCLSPASLPKRLLISHSFGYSHAHVPSYCTCLIAY